MATQQSSIFSKGWRRLLKFKRLIAILGLASILLALLFGNGIVRWTWITPHFHKKITNLDNTNGFSYVEGVGLENDGYTYGYLNNIQAVIRDNRGTELGSFMADSCLVDNKMIDISEVQLAEGKTTPGLCKFFQKSSNKITFHSGVSYKLTITCNYYSKISLKRFISITHKDFTFALSDSVIKDMNNPNLKERTNDLSTPLTE